MKTLPIIIAALHFATGAARAGPLPLPKPPGPGGSCPHGYLSSGSYCVPSQGAQDAVPKPPTGTITATCRRTSSDARSGCRSA
jgi:hypothetical protein